MQRVPGSTPSRAAEDQTSGPTHLPLPAACERASRLVVGGDVITAVIAGRRRPVRDQPLVGEFFVGESEQAKTKEQPYAWTPKWLEGALKLERPCSLRNDAKPASKSGFLIEHRSLAGDERGDDDLSRMLGLR